MKLIQRTSELVITLSLVSIMLTGCGKKADNKKVVKKSDDDVTKSIELAEKQEVTVNNSTEPTTFDPHKSIGFQELIILHQMFMGLTSIDGAGNTIAGVATEWSSKDNQVWIFKLRKSQWSNGDPLTAHDFVYSLRRLADAKNDLHYTSFLTDSKLRNAQQIIDGKMPLEKLGVTAIDDYTLQFDLSEPIPYFPDTLIHIAGFPVHQKTVEKYGDKWIEPQNIVVNGAYKLSQWVANHKVVIVRNNNFYDDNNTTVKRGVFIPIKSDQEAIEKYKKGEIDYTKFSKPELYFEVLKKDLKKELHTAPSLCTYYYSINTSKAPFDKPNVRRALSWTVDRDIITQRVLGLGQSSAYQMTSNASHNNVKYIPKWAKWSKKQRQERASKLMKEAGYSADNPLRFKAMYNDNSSHKPIIESMSRSWNEAFGKGVVQVDMVAKPWDDYMKSIELGDYQMIRVSWCAVYNEPSSFLNQFQSNHEYNTGKYSSKAYDDIMHSTLKVGISKEERAQLYSKAEAQLDQDAPIIPIYHYVDTGLYKPYLKGFAKDNPLAMWQLKDVKVVKHSTSVEQ